MALLTAVQSAAPFFFTCPCHWEFSEAGIAAPVSPTVLVLSLIHIYAPFKLDKAADTVVLAAPDGRILDSVEINGLDNDIALVRGGDGQWSRTAAVSPGYPNTAEGMEAFWKAQDASRTGLRINERCV